LIKAESAAGIPLRSWSERDLLAFDAAPGGIGTVKPSKNVRQVRWGDADSGILDRNEQSLILRTHRDYSSMISSKARRLAGSGFAFRAATSATVLMNEKRAAKLMGLIGGETLEFVHSGFEPLEHRVVRL
jgi:hypothetical protein